jgi:hypothetical protein
VMCAAILTPQKLTMVLLSEAPLFSATV